MDLDGVHRHRLKLAAGCLLHGSFSSCPLRARCTAAVLMDVAGVFFDKLQKTWSKESEMVWDTHPILKRNIAEVDCSFSVTGSIFVPLT